MRAVVYLLLSVTIVILTSCFEDINPVDATVVIRNNSNIDIAYYFKNNKISDTSLYTIGHSLSKDYFVNRIISARGVLEIPDSYRKSLKKMPKDEVMMVFLFSRDTIEQVPWERIADEYMVLKRFDLTLDSLERRNWVLEYP